MNNTELNMKFSNIMNFSIDKCYDYINRYIELNKKFYVCLIDVEKFRYFNYIYGYKKSNKIFNDFFNYIYNKLGTNIDIFRFSNDRIIFISEICKKEEICDIEKILDDLRGYKTNIDGCEILVDFRAGIAVYPIDCNNAENILKYSEIALNYAKKVSKNKYEFFKIHMYNKILEKSRYAFEIYSAFEKNEFAVYYQPQVDIKTMKLYGMEALLRWDNPNIGVISPMYFIELLENSKMIQNVGKFVFEEACNTLKIYEKLGYNNLTVSINMSKIQFEDERFLISIEDILEKTQVNPNNINIEITERFFVESTDTILNILGELRNKGMKVFIDDFGIKYSSLNYLFKLPIDGIKIDKSFIDRIHYSHKELTIVKNIINLAKDIGLMVVAEGVEKNEQLKCLEEIHCNNIQGFIFGKPVNSKYFIDYLKLLY